MKPYVGEYKKIEYRIRLKDGEVIDRCWPNADTFHDLDGSGRVISGSKVAEFEQAVADFVGTNDIDHGGDIDRRSGYIAGAG